MSQWNWETHPNTVAMHAEMVRLRGEIERLKEDRDEWRVLADEHLAKLIDCKKELAAVTKERDEWATVAESAKVRADIMAEQLAAVTRELKEYKADHSTRNFRVVELLEQLAACQNDADHIRELFTGLWVGVSLEERNKWDARAIEMFDAVVEEQKT